MFLFSKKYRLNPETLRFERIRLTGIRKARVIIMASLGIIALAVLLRYGFERYYPTPRQIIYEFKNQKLRSGYEELNSNLVQLESQLAELRNRDDGFYRSILCLEPVSSSIREAGTGGATPYTHLNNLRDPALVKGVSRKIDQLSNRIKIQSSSLENVLEEAITNVQYLACRPSINPISSADPFWMTSSYGYRNDPFTHRRVAHHGIDLAGPYGLDIHVTGDGTVIGAQTSRYGYGKEVLVDHGFGYVTRYAHLQEILVKPGQELKRGQIVGTMGSTGRSTGPHLHYEVIKNGRPDNPMYYFYEDLKPEEYSLMASRSTMPDLPYRSVAYSQK